VKYTTNRNISKDVHVYVYPSLTREWEDFTDVHRRVREISEEAVRRFSYLLRGMVGDEGAPPLIIAGGLGSGKTQLLYHLFKYSWRTLKVPTLYVNLRTVLSQTKLDMAVRGRSGRLEPTEFVSTLLRLALTKLELIKKNFANGGLKLSDLWLPEIVGQPAEMPPSKLFERIGVAPNEAFDTITKALESKRGVVLLIDEVEMAYKELKDLIEGGLRDLVDVIGRGTMGIYTVMAVSYLSYYELFLSEFTGDVAFARRIRLVQLPPIDPDVLYEKLKPHNASDKSNTFWWFTRGRLGWVTSLKDVILIDDTSVGSLLEWVKAPQLRTPIAENLPILDVDELLRLEDKYCQGNAECSAALRYFILNIKPLKVKDLPDFVKVHLDKLSTLLIHCRDLVGVAKVVDAFVNDIKEFCDREGIMLEDEDLELVRRALNDILSALALRTEGDKLVCLGAPNNLMLSDEAYNYIDSLIDILMTYIAENYVGTSERVRTVTEALYLVHSLALSRERWKEPKTFYEAKRLFDGNIGQNYVIIGPWVIEKLIPLYLSSPIISREPGITIEKLEQDLRSYLLSYAESEIADVITNLSEYIAQRREETLIYVVPVPRPQYMSAQVKEKIYNVVKELVHRHIHDLEYGSRRLMVFFAGGDADSIQYIRDRLRREDELLDLLINQTKRVSLDQIPGERLSDFVKSLFNLLISSMNEMPGATIEGVVSTLKPDQKRRVEYFKATLITWLNDAMERLTRERESSLSIDDLRFLSAKLMDDINVLSSVAKRSEKFRAHIRAYAAFFTVIGVYDPFEKMRLSLSPGGLIKVKALPSIYQEFHRRDKCKAVTELLNVPIISDIVRAAIRNKRDLPLADALRILEEEDIPLFNDFVEVLERSTGIRRSEYSTAIRLLYKVLLLNMLLSLRKDDVMTLLQEKASKIKAVGERLNELLEDIKKISDNMCRELPLCIKIVIRPKDKTHTLEDEITGVLSALEEIEKWLGDLKSGKDIGYNRFLSLAYMAVFGLPEEDDALLEQIHKALEGWYGDLYHKVYERLSSIQQKLRQLPIQLGGRKKTIEIVANSLDDLDNVEHRLSEILNEVNTVMKEYEDTLREIEDAKTSLQTMLEKALNAIEKLNKLYAV